MSRSFRLTRRAEDSLTDIARWTIDSFGLRQAEIYQEELLNRCAAILNGEAYSRSCGVLVDDADDLRFVRAGEHYLVFWISPMRSSLSTSCTVAVICPVMLRR